MFFCCGGAGCVQYHFESPAASEWGSHSMTSVVCSIQQGAGGNVTILWKATNEMWRSDTCCA